jgi:hypothetical protein
MELADKKLSLAPYTPDFALSLGTILGHAMIELAIHSESLPAKKGSII